MDYYHILGVEQSASPDEIKRLYRKLAVKLHPDKTDKKEDHERFLQIHQAYEILKDDALRRKYDHENRSKSSHSSSTAYSSYTSHTSTSGGFGMHGFSYDSEHPSYYSFYSRSAREYDNSREREKQETARMAARMAERMMREDMKRRQEEYMRDARQRQQAELREQLEQRLREERDQLRSQAERDQNSSRYTEVKQEAFERQWRPKSSDGFGMKSFSSSQNSSAPQPGDTSSLPIVVEDEGVEDSNTTHETSEDLEDRSDVFEDCQDLPPVNDEPEALFSEQPQTPYLDPEVVEVDDAKTTPVQGRRAPSITTNSAKKPKISMDDLRHPLGTDIEEVDFDDMLSSLPKTPGRTRKASNLTQLSLKRPRLATYFDGTSRLLTLFTPINKNVHSVPRNNTISPTDLAPNVDESKLVFEVLPPLLRVTDSLSLSAWDHYVTEINEYQQKFAEYRRVVMEHQAGRFEKDDRHHRIIFLDTSCLNVYQTCLFNDVLLLQHYTRALQEYRETIKRFVANCEKVNAL